MSNADNNMTTGHQPAKGKSGQDPLLKNMSPRLTHSSRSRTSSSYPSITSGLEPYNGEFGRTQLIHLLRRTMFGIKRADLDYFEGKSLNEVVDELLIFPTAIPSEPLMWYTSEGTGNPGTDWAGVKQGEAWPGRLLPPNNLPASTDNYWRGESVRHWNIGLAVNQGRSVYEKIVLFWHNHFPVSASSVDISERTFQYSKMLRENANASLKDLAVRITKDLAMLSYLNGEVNTRFTPDENYAREIQELFIIGKELPFDQRYTEDDVKAAARLLTGHQNVSSNYLEAKYGFVSYNHDTSDKQFSAFYGNTMIKGRSGADAGDLELNDFITMLFDDTQPLPSPNSHMTRADVIADYIVKKIYRFFVYYDIDDNILTNVIKPLADIYKNNNFTIKPVLEALFKSEHFFDAENMRCYIKQPMDVVLGLMRTLDIDYHREDTVTQYNTYWTMNYRTSEMQQGYIEPPNVSGWSPFYQSPQFHKLWINSDTLPKRQEFARLLVSWGLWSFNYTPNLRLDHIGFVKTLKNPENPNAIIDQLEELLLGRKLTTAHKQKLKQDTLLYGQVTDNYWTYAWQNGTKENATEEQKNTVVYLLVLLFDYMVRLEEFQLM